MTADDATRPSRAGREPYDVLQVEDNPGDARFTREAFSAAAPDVDLEVVDSGPAALDRLADDRRASPSLILLDLDLGETSGFDVLRALREDDSTGRVPVVVFSDSTDRDDVRTTYDMGANAYVPKPRDATGYFETIDRLAAFWLATGTLPTGGEDD